MFTIYNIRERARQTLNETPGIYQVAVIPVTISVIVQLISFSRNSLAGVTAEELANPSYFISTSLFPLFYGLLLGLLHLSIICTIFHLIKGVKTSTSFKNVLMIFNHKDFWKIFRTYILKSFLLFLWGLLFYFGIGLLIGAGTMITIIAASSQSLDPDALPMEILAILGLMAMGGILLMVLGITLYIPQFYAYSQVEYILFEQLERKEYTGAFSIIRSSRKLMKGYKFKRFTLDLSFIGWFLLVIITFGLAGLYIWPYHYAAQMHFHEEILDDQAKKMSYV
ncbi:TPA: DUF975 family protein [Streptococcus suis]|uniref:DUF975 family protein n=1 Tax=Streptococcus suis TaxID=1307 RepID=UPI00041495A9|nr:DUF975 family protein [Streptococcus suis]HEM3173339.1 DUF975 family protein [Streptococcus suis]HEM4059703.1 DUF975 family protein [Streptococcus suis]